MGKPRKSAMTAVRRSASSRVGISLDGPQDSHDAFRLTKGGRPTFERVMRTIGMFQRSGVEYNTLREKTNQSPAESMRQGMASCTGLSVLLVDALRAVGIPARFAGTAAWHDDRGNHSWTEV